MRPDDPATAEGDLRRTPLPHLLVYMADRRLTGALFLRDPEGTEHAIRFEWGSPVRVWPGDGYALFGELLVEQGVVSRDVVDNALATKGLLGDVLILTGHADGETLERVALLQHERRIAHLFGLPEATSYSYFDGHNALAEGAGPPCRGDVLRIIIAGLRAHPRACMSIARLMEKLNDVRLRMHHDAALDRFGWNEQEAKVAATVQRDRPTIVDLLASDVADTDTIRRVVYVLLLTRHLELGQRLPPLGVEETPPLVALGRVHLTPAMHREGAAAPDPSGDGERAAVQPRTLHRRKAADTPSRPPPPPMSDLEDDPVSDVVEIGAPRSSRPRDTGTSGTAS
jgi:hypothetical protein